MYDRKYSANLIISCSGNQTSEIFNTPYGEARSRNGAKLKYVQNDSNAIQKVWNKHSRIKNGTIILSEPTKQEVLNSINYLNEVLSEYPQNQTGIDLFFAGHGDTNGDLVLTDESISAKEILDCMSEPLVSDIGDRGISVFLDCCHSGGFLINLVIEVENKEMNIRLYDAKISSLYNERSYELSFLESGVLTFTYCNYGNEYVKPGELSKAIEEQDQKTIARCIQGLVATMASPVSYLTCGKQHAIDVSKGRYFSIHGFGEFELPNDKKITRELLVELFEKAKRKY
ncbi:caspase family protein [Aquimarina sp. AU119]|uniref:caspase family protein n=1 Tax=Aquimarina sp. AU119 TaxID=2108528 RepID=UPI000D690DF9|nr:caspase family protein [Aquimarina sp. AU119]